MKMFKPFPTRATNTAFHRILRNVSGIKTAAKRGKTRDSQIARTLANKQFYNRFVKFTRSRDISRERERSGGETFGQRLPKIKTKLVGKLAEEREIVPSSQAKLHSSKRTTESETPVGGDRRTFGKPVKEGFASFLKGAANIKITF